MNVQHLVLLLKHIYLIRLYFTTFLDDHLHPFSRIFIKHATKQCMVLNILLFFYLKLSINKYDIKRSIILSILFYFSDQKSGMKKNSKKKQGVCD